MAPALGYAMAVLAAKGRSWASTPCITIPSHCTYPLPRAHTPAPLHIPSHPTVHPLCHPCTGLYTGATAWPVRAVQATNWSACVGQALAYSIQARAQPPPHALIRHVKVTNTRAGRAPAIRLTRHPPLL